MLVQFNSEDCDRDFQQQESLLTITRLCYSLIKETLKRNEVGQEKQSAIDHVANCVALHSIAASIDKMTKKEIKEENEEMPIASNKTGS